MAATNIDDMEGESWFPKFGIYVSTPSLCDAGGSTDGMATTNNDDLEAAGEGESWFYDPEFPHKKRGRNQMCLESVC